MNGKFATHWSYNDLNAYPAMASLEQLSSVQLVVGESAVTQAE